MPKRHHDQNVAWEPHHPKHPKKIKHEVDEDPNYLSTNEKKELRTGTKNPHVVSELEKKQALQKHIEHQHDEHQHAMQKHQHDEHQHAKQKHAHPPKPKKKPLLKPQKD